jgi:hypothetical protein
MHARLPRSLDIDSGQGKMSKLEHIDSEGGGI